ncbi:Cof-type HAD-IIB family hydrolase [Spirulina sp. 06S082]|uniref:Cof-type HAD-IIB family hydrolase n=1 Tax=Spirulina sp. 06S082 TaxID=3110248 RepID=UPI002B1F417F|nr:Cof-type HAD-IIB family hydrolase [Spirulina sp. 06S082]MEA5467438.1 Cof-type HAD-IIB family hydrolase [Spirulina sp. 06S082]
MGIRLLVLDVDGTIAGTSNQVSEVVKRAIAEVQNRGIQVAIATGRMYRSALRFHQAIGSQLPIIAYNGAWIQNPITGEILRHSPLSLQSARELLDYYEQPQWRDRVDIHCYWDDCLYVRESTQYTREYIARSGIQANVTQDLRTLLIDPPTKILALSPDVDAIQEMMAILKDRYSPSELYLTKSSPYFLEATYPGVNKATALHFLTTEILGYAAENVMAIGDNYNDLEMLEYAGLGIAMGDAPPDVQKIAKWVAPSVDEDGVAEAIAKFLL